MSGEMSYMAPGAMDPMMGRNNMNMPNMRSRSDPMYAMSMPGGMGGMGGAPAVKKGTDIRGDRQAGTAENGSGKRC